MEKITIKLTTEQIEHIKKAYKYIEQGIDHSPSGYDLEMLGFFGSVMIDIQDQMLERADVKNKTH